MNCKPVYKFALFLAVLCFLICMKLTHLPGRYRRGPQYKETTLSELHEHVSRANTSSEGIENGEYLLPEKGNNSRGDIFVEATATPYNKSEGEFLVSEEGSENAESVWGTGESEEFPISEKGNIRAESHAALYEKSPGELLFQEEGSDDSVGDMWVNEKEFPIPEKGNMNEENIYVKSHGALSQYKQTAGEFLIEEKGSDSAGDLWGKGDHETYLDFRAKAEMAQTQLELTFLKRRQHLEKICATLNLSSTTFNNETIKLFSHVIVIPKYKLLYCEIPKVSSTSWKRLLLVLHGELLFRDPKQTKKNANNAFAKRFQRLSQVKLDEAKRLMKEYTSFVFVRNPYSRLLSAYRSKLVSPTKRERYRQSNVIHWLDTHESNLIKYSDKEVTFGEFVAYYLKAERQDVHWKDMHEICFPCLFNYTLIGHYETLKADSDYIFELIKAPLDIKFPDQNNSVTQSSKEDILVEYYAELTDSQLFNLSMSSGFRRDLSLFGYEIPPAINRWLF